MRTERRTSGPAKAGRYSRTRCAGTCRPAAGGPAVEAAGTLQAPSLELILAGVKTLLRGRGTVTLPAAGLDLLFDAGVVARCRACGLSWHVSRSQYSCAGWWTCPSGCHAPGHDQQA